MMAPSACHILRRFLFIFLIFLVTLTAPCIEGSFEILPLKNENLQSSRKSSAVNAETATTGATTSTATRAPGAPLPPPRFPLTYDGLLRRRRRAAPSPKAPRDTQYPYDEAPGSPRAPSGRRPLQMHGDFPHDASRETVHSAGNADRKYHDNTRKLHLPAMRPIRSAPACAALHAMRSCNDCKTARSERTDDVPSQSHRVVVRVNLSWNQRAFRKKIIRHGFYVKICREHRGSDTVYLVENSPDIQRAFGLSKKPQNVPSAKAYRYPENTYYAHGDFHIHNIQRDPVSKNIFFLSNPFRERGLGKYYFLPDGRRNQFPDISSKNENNPYIYDDLHTHVLCKSYKLGKHSKGHKPHKPHKPHKSFAFRDIIYGTGSRFSRLFRGGGSSNQRTLRGKMYTKGHSPDIHDGHVFHRDDIFPHLFHYLHHSHRPHRQHSFRGLTRNASASEQEVASPSPVSPPSDSP